MVLETCDRAIVLKDGEVAANETTLEVLTDVELLDKCGLEAPLFFAEMPGVWSRHTYRDRVIMLW